MRKLFVIVCGRTVLHARRPYVGCVLTQHQIIPHNLISQCTTSHHTTPPHITVYHIISYYITSYHTTSYHSVSHHIIPHHLTLHHITSYHTTSYSSASHHIIPHHLITYHTTTHNSTLQCITSYHFLLFRTCFTSASCKPRWTLTDISTVVIHARATVFTRYLGAHVNVSGRNCENKIFNFSTNNNCYSRL